MKPRITSPKSERIGKIWRVSAMDERFQPYEAYGKSEEEAINALFKQIVEARKAKELNIA